jgi:plastocyanin
MNRRLALPLLAIAAGALLSAPAGASLRQIAVGNFYFEDETVGDGKVVAQVGDQLRFSVLDSGPGTPHTVEVNELGIHSGSLAAGETFTTPPIATAGTFILYCKPHDQRGHKTTLVVSGTSITTATTAPTTTTTTAATTTAKPTTTTKPPTTTTTVSAGGAPSSSASTTTTAKPTTTTAPTTTSAAVGAGTAAPGTGDPGAGDATSGGGEAAAPAEGDPAGGTDPGETAFAPVGRGTVDDLAGGPAAGSFDELLDRRLRGRNGPWTRSIRLALAALVPMALAAGVALRRWPGPLPDTGER